MALRGEYTLRGEPTPSIFSRSRFDPNNEQDQKIIQQVVKGFSAGAYSEDDVNNWLKKYPEAATAAIPGIQAAKNQRQKEHMYGQYFHPGGQEKVPQVGEMGESYPAQTQQVKPRAGFDQALLQAMSGGDIATAKDISGIASQVAARGGGEKPENVFAKINPKDYTTQSVAKFEQSLRYADLVPTDETKNDPEKVAAIATGARKEFTGLSKTFIDVVNSYGRIQESSKAPSPAGDLALIFNYMKMLDPQSVVRESEFAVAANAAPMLQRLGLDWNKVKNVWEGQKLTDNQRGDFVNRSGALYKRQLASHQKLESQYRELAKRLKVDPDTVVLDFSLSEMKQDKLSAESEAWVSKAMKTNPGMSREQIIVEGKKRGKIR